jgi:hypothetical protein
LLKTFLRDSFQFLWDHLRQIALIILPISIPASLLSTASEEWVKEDAGGAVSMLPMLIDAMVAPLYEAALILFVARTIQGERLDTLTSWRLALPLWLPLLALYILVGLAVGAGLILLIVPGVIIGARLVFAEFELVLEKRPVGEALSRSWAASKPYVWTIILGYLLLLFLILGSSYLVAMILDTESAIVGVLVGACYSVLGAVTTVFVYRVYYESHDAKRQAVQSNFRPGPR